MRIVLIFLAIAAVALGSSQVQNELWNITYQVEEMTRGSISGFLASMELKNSSKCFKEVEGLVTLLEDIIDMLKKNDYSFRRIARILNEFAQWFAAEWYSCGDLVNFWPKFQVYLNKIAADILGYILKVLGGFAIGILNILKSVYYFIYHHAREEYFKAGIEIGNFIFDRFFRVLA